MAETVVRRLYRPLIREHFQKYRQMLFLMGARQVGKTTLCLSLPESIQTDFTYLNWDNLNHRETLIEGPVAIAKTLQLDRPKAQPPLLILDEIHKYPNWKTFLKGFFDTYSHAGEVKIVVTGSARLDIYKAGGDSLMGRYFRYRIHPFSCAELITSDPADSLTRLPQKPDDAQFNALFSFGGFPEPLFKNEMRFYQNWSKLRLQQLFYEDIRDLTRIQEIKQMELLALHLAKQAGSLFSYTSLSKKIRTSLETVRRWMQTLTQLYYSFPVQPWSKNITRSLLKEPKVYLWDWSLVRDNGARAENLVASHLLKACHYWTDRGDGDFGLYYLRDKQKREVDFVVVKDGKPWFLVEVKKSNGPISPHLAYFLEATGAKHAFQVEMERKYEEIDCFAYTHPIAVPAQTFLSQLV